MTRESIYTSAYRSKYCQLYGHSEVMYDIDGNTPLTLAAYDGHAKVVGELLKAANVDVNKANNHGNTPLTLAARNGHAKVVRELLKAANVDVNKANNDGSTPLTSAAYDGHAKVVGELLKAANVDVNKANNHGNTPLTLAARNGHAKVVRELLKAANVDVNEANNDGDTPLTLAAHEGHTKVVMELLKAANVDVNKADNHGDTPLTCAVRYSDKPAVDDPWPIFWYSPVFRLMKAGAVHVDPDTDILTRITRTARFQTMTFLNKFLHVPPEWVDCAINIFVPMLFLPYLVGVAAVFAVVVFKERFGWVSWIAGFLLSFFYWCICVWWFIFFTDPHNENGRYGLGFRDVLVLGFGSLFFTLGLTTVFALLIFDDIKPGVWIGSAFLSLLISSILLLAGFDYYYYVPWDFRDMVAHRTMRWLLFFTLVLTPVFALLIFKDNKPMVWIGSVLLSFLILCNIRYSMTICWSFQVI